jgi:hypothetical protein
MHTGQARRKSRGVESESDIDIGEAGSWTNFKSEGLARQFSPDTSSNLSCLIPLQIRRLLGDDTEDSFNKISPKTQRRHSKCC